MTGFGKYMKIAFWLIMGLTCAGAVMMFVSDTSGQTMQDWLRELFQEGDVTTWMLVVGSVLVCVLSCLRTGLGDSGFLAKLFCPVAATFLGVVYSFVLAIVCVLIDAVATGAIWEFLGGIVVFLVIGAGCMRPQKKIVGFIVEE